MVAVQAWQRTPEKTLLYQTIQRNFEAFAQAFEVRSGGSLPKYIRREFESYLACGIHAHGFFQLACGGCGEISLLPFSCKKRGFCPSCGARKMAEEAAFLTDWVLPNSIGYRQYVLTFPMPLRFWVAKNKTLLSQLYRIFSREVLRRVEWSDPSVPTQQPLKKIAGTIAFIQRFGDGLRYNPHIHLLATEGGWVKSDNPPDSLEFVQTPAPTSQEVCALLERIQTKIVRFLSRKGYLREDLSQAETSGVLAPESSSEESPEQQLLIEMQGCSTQNRFALSDPPGKLVQRERHSELGSFGKIGEHARLGSEEGRLAILKGFSLHAGTFVPARDVEELAAPLGQGGLERLLRYMARNSTPLERLKPVSGGDILVKLKTRWSDGTTHLRFSGLELMERLSALIPPPGFNLIRYGGCFAPRHKWRVKIVALAPKAGTAPAAASPESQAVECEENAGLKKPYRLSWAQLRARIFEEDVEQCKQCGGKLKISAAILERDAIVRILGAKGLSSEIPSFDPPPRAPPHGSADKQYTMDWA